MHECCDICGCIPMCVTRIYANTPFIDGRHYQVLCFTCMSVPKKWEYNEQDSNLEYYDNPSPYYLHSVQEMVEDGFAKLEAEDSIRAIKRLISNNLHYNHAEQLYVYDKLFFNGEVEILGWPDQCIIKIHKRCDMVR